MLTLGFTAEEQMSMFRTISGILHFGNIEVKQRPREEWATIPNTTGMYNHRTFPTLYDATHFVFHFYVYRG